LYRLAGDQQATATRQAPQTPQTPICKSAARHSYQTTIQPMIVLTQSSLHANPDQICMAGESAIGAQQFGLV